MHRQHTIQTRNTRSRHAQYTLSSHIVQIARAHKHTKLLFTLNKSYDSQLYPQGILISFLIMLQSMKERSREIAIHMDMLKAQAKAAEEEKQTIRFVLYGTFLVFSFS